MYYHKRFEKASSLTKTLYIAIDEVMPCARRPSCVTPHRAPHTPRYAARTRTGIPTPLSRVSLERTRRAMFSADRDSTPLRAGMACSAQRHQAVIELGRQRGAKVGEDVLKRLALLRIE